METALVVRELPDLSDEELIQRIQARDDQDAYHELYGRHADTLRHTVSVVASKYTFKDLSEWTSLIHAIFTEAKHKFDVTRGASFAVYLSWKLKQRVLDHVREYTYETTPKESRSIHNDAIYARIAKENALCARAIELRLAGHDDLSLGKRLGFAGTHEAIMERVERLFEKLRGLVSEYYVTA